jgi:hypothetical protein
MRGPRRLRTPDSTLEIAKPTTSSRSGDNRQRACVGRGEATLTAFLSTVLSILPQRAEEVLLAINKWSNRSSAALKWVAVINNEQAGELVNPGASFTLAPGDDRLPPGADVTAVGWAAAGFSGLLVSRTTADGTAFVALDGSATNQQIDDALKSV